MNRATRTALRELVTVLAFCEADDTLVIEACERLSADAPALIVAALSPSALNDTCGALGRATARLSQIIDSCDVGQVRMYRAAWTSIDDLRAALRVEGDKRTGATP